MLVASKLENEKDEEEYRDIILKALENKQDEEQYKHNAKGTNETSVFRMDISISDILFIGYEKQILRTTLRRVLIQGTS